MTISTRVKTNQLDSVQCYAVIANRARYVAIGRIVFSYDQRGEALLVLVFAKGSVSQERSLEAIRACNTPRRALSGFLGGRFYDCDDAYSWAGSRKSCASGAACGARISNVRPWRVGGVLNRQRAAATTAKSKVAAAIK